MKARIAISANCFAIELTTNCSLWFRTNVIEGAGTADIKAKSFYINLCQIFFGNQCHCIGVLRKNVLFFT